MIAKRSRQVGILALSTIADDPRVRRQGDAFHAAGWDVIAFGLPSSGRSPNPPWPIVDCDTANVPASLDEVPSESSRDEDPSSSPRNQDLNVSARDEDLNDLSNEEASLSDLSSAPFLATTPLSSRFRSILKQVLPLPVRDVLRPYSSRALLRAEARGALQKCAAVLPDSSRSDKRLADLSSAAFLGTTPSSS